MRPSERGVAERHERGDHRGHRASLLFRPCEVTCTCRVWLPPCGIDGSESRYATATLATHTHPTPFPPAAKKSIHRIALSVELNGGVRGSWTAV